LTLLKPKYISDANISSPIIRFAWDEWNVMAAYKPPDPTLVERMARVSHRANVATCAALAEWIVWRFESLSGDIVPYQIIESGWASIVHLAYAKQLQFVDDSWRGAIRGPMRISLEILLNLIWGIDNSTPGENAAWMTNLAKLVLPDCATFDEWLEGSIDSLEKYFPAPLSNEDILFSDEFDVGPWVPRELFDPDRDFDPNKVPQLMKRFVESLDYTSNPYLRDPKAMKQFPDFEGTPYSL